MTMEGRPNWALYRLHLTNMIEKCRESHQLTVELQTATSELDVLRKQAEADLDVPDDINQLWQEYDNLRRHKKALALREILEDYEF